MKILFLEIDTEAQWALASPGPAHLAAYIRAGGHRAALRRIPLGANDDDILTAVNKEHADLIGLSLTARQWPRAARVAAVIKAHRNTPLIAGGLHPTFAPDSVLCQGAFDYVCIGEGERPLHDLLDRLQSGPGAADTAIPGIRTPRAAPPPLPPPEPDLDRLPFAARDLMDEHWGVRHLSTQRGCPFPCTFCAAPAIGALYPKAAYLRRRSVANVLEEIRALAASGPLSYLVFLDDTFTLNPAWVAEFCARYAAEFTLGFSINARVETMTQERVEQLASAGCRHIIYGVESGSPRIRKAVLKRPVEDRQFEQVFRWTQQAGILATANYMLGIPGETAADIEKTLALHRQLDPDDFGFFVFHPYPGTPLHRLCRERGYLPEKAEEMPLQEGRSMLTLPDLSRAEIADYYRRFGALRDALYRDRYGG